MTILSASLADAPISAESYITVCCAAVFISITVMRRQRKARLNDMAQYITTYTGVHFYPLEPDPEGILIEDIAHALSMHCRANGHYKYFYSVADHCIDCAAEAEARGLDPYVSMLCLLHDAAEAYISDIPRPVKRDLKGIYEIEDRIAEMVYIKFAGRTPDKKEFELMREIDDAMLYHEFRANMGEELTYGEMLSARSFKSRCPSEAEREFIERFEVLRNRLHGI